MPAPPSFPGFRARAPWWGPDLQTLRNFLRPPKPHRGAATSERLQLPMADGSGDELAAWLEQPNEPRPDAPLVVLIHGLSGDETSSYIVASSAHLLELGFPVLRLNLRGAGPSRATCRNQYHAGRSEDLRDALHALPEPLMRNGLALVGYSLGGNMLLKFLAEFGLSCSIRRAVSVSAPIDLSAASHRFLDSRNRLYHMHMLRRMKQESFGEGAGTTEEEAQAIRRATSILEFDEYIVAPRNGFADAEAYYAACHARQFLGSIRTPTLMIHAQDDPWIPAETYLSFDWKDNPALVPLLPEGGGHVGFHGEGSTTPWYDRCLGEWLALD
ncbi:MAG: alpha/beta fold hydrolase [Deltaproteobacteria bacterium]|nr:alpha/beta fold hydrolase [Deltaproteobacteria bacterium]